MLQSVYATKMGMTQAWTKTGKRLPVTKCKAESVAVVAVRDVMTTDVAVKNRPSVVTKQVQIGLGTKKLARMHKPLRAQLQAQGFSHGVQHLKSVYLTDQTTEVTPGTLLPLADVLTVGDVVQVQGTTKGKGFAGVVKRYGFAGGPKTHGQSDRHRAPGSIGQGTTPGRVYKNKRMPGHMGNETVTVQNLTVIHLDSDSGEIWLSGPVPGSITSLLKITKTGQSKPIDLNRTASFLPEPTEVKTEEAAVEEVTEAEETEVVASTEETAPTAESAETKENTPEEAEPVKPEEAMA